METGVIVALIASVCSLLVAIITPLLNHKKLEAERKKLIAEQKKLETETATMVQDAAIELIKPLKAELMEQRGEIVKLKKVLSRAMSRITYLMGGISVLTQQITKHGDTPEWTPDDWHEDCE